MADNDSGQTQEPKKAQPQSGDVRKHDPFTWQKPTIREDKTPRPTMPHPSGS